MALNFGYRSKSKASTGSRTGRFTRQEAKKIVSDQFSGMGLNNKAKNYLIRRLDKGGKIDTRKFNKILNEATEEKIIKKTLTEKIKDKVKIPDSWNKHYD